MLGKLVWFAVIGLALSALGDRVRAAASDGHEASYSNSLTAEERAAGWKLLFDGKSMAGWREYRKTGLSPKWHVADGAMTFEDSGRKEGLGIVSADQYDNFELILEWKIEKGTNSGLMYRVSESEAKPYATGPEYQILDDAAYPKEPSKRQCGSCYDLYTPAMQAAKPPGQWNRLRLLVNGNHVEHWLNGDKIVEYDFHSADWNDRRKNSKWKDYPRYGSEPKGYICLQEHGSTVSFRSIKILPLRAGGRD